MCSIHALVSYTGEDGKTVPVISGSEWALQQGIMLHKKEFNCEGKITIYNMPKAYAPKV